MDRPSDLVRQLRGQVRMSLTGLFGKAADIRLVSQSESQAQPQETRDGEARPMPNRSCCLLPVGRLQVDLHLFTRLTNPVTGILGA